SGTEFQDIAKKIASVDTLDAFLRDLRAKYPESSAISQPAAGEGAAAAAGGKSASANAPPASRAAAPGTRNASSSPLPPNAPAGLPVKPDKEPTGSIPRLPRTQARGQARAR
ncbi:MAG TPA: hypothetical protein VJR71_01005, partial [Pseudolabrys sp.]|nr:hypothetical protein [Pseudolabrys sp.]